MATVTLKRTKKTDLLGKPSYKDAKTYFAVSLSRKTGERVNIFDNSDEIEREKELDYFARALNIKKEELATSSSDYWRDYTFIMQGERAELDDTDPVHKLVLKVLEKDSRVALSEDDLKNKSQAEYLLIKEAEVTENKVKRRAVKAEAYSKFNIMGEEDLQNMLLVYGKNPKNLTLNRIKELVGDELDSNPDRFLKFVEDKNFDNKVFISDLVQEGIIRKSGTSYVYDGEMIAHDNMSMLDFIKTPKNTNIVIAFKKQLNEKKGLVRYEV